LVKESRMAEDYTFEITFEGERGGKNIIEITCIPKPEAAIVWGKVVVIVEQGTYLPVRLDYYDEDLDLARTLSYSGNKRFGDRTLPARLTITPTDKPGESTTVIYEDIRFNLDLPDSQFTLRELQR
ncbi:MAG: outer membrane lipoprotein-sorting protein, partial [Chrysiogenetes bacterium]|nr:outer membrane lipoprotein-sorting protein [Chrysiogenetes bacterium]